MFAAIGSCTNACVPFNSKQSASFQARQSGSTRIWVDNQIKLSITANNLEQALGHTPKAVDLHDDVSSLDHLVGFVGMVLVPFADQPSLDLLDPQGIILMVGYVQPNLGPSIRLLQRHAYGLSQLRANWRGRGLHLQNLRRVLL